MRKWRYMARPIIIRMIYRCIPTNVFEIRLMWLDYTIHFSTNAQCNPLFIILFSLFLLIFNQFPSNPEINMTQIWHSLGLIFSWYTSIDGYTIALLFPPKDNCWSNNKFLNVSSNPIIFIWNHKWNVIDQSANNN